MRAALAALALSLLMAGPVSAADRLSGRASWYQTPGLTGAAGPALRQALGKGWRGSRVTVCSDRCVTVTLTDWCQCYKGTRRERLIDLSDGAFARLAPLIAGLVRVRIVLGGLAQPSKIPMPETATPVLTTPVLTTPGFFMRERYGW